ncbi:DNA polymerase epsilon subunit 3-like [Varroa jacobsoni]|uniref:DNA polymerase epsilon subunit 3-like n=1 Tax=Varroa jacobsoni TaxID=62625 RepID=UPI000BF91FEE|nr:DNA polymerase epsilon subunit 3-like [Varroa jacobsoni]
MAERPEDFNLPVSVVARLLKESLPENVSVSKEARAALAKAASIFVLYSTSLSNNFANKSKRKMVSGQDVMAAMEDMELEAFKPQLEEALEAFRRDKSAKKDKKKAKDGTTKNSSGDGSVEAKLQDNNNDVEMAEDANSDQDAADQDDD